MGIEPTTTHLLLNSNLFKWNFFFLFFFIDCDLRMWSQEERIFKSILQFVRFEKDDQV